MSTRLYGLFWKWHFIAGLIACPVLAIIALTGAIYVFEPELRRVGDPDVLVVEPAETRYSLDELVAVAQTQCDVGGMSVPGPRDAAYNFYCRKGDKSFFVDPYRGTLLGEPSSAMKKVLDVSFALHWELMLGEPGRLVIEWATSWGLLLLISGVILWWPRGKRRAGGVLYPRGRLKARQLLRDLHAVFGAYAVPVLVFVLATGLMWTRCAGDERWNKLASEAAHEHPKSKVLAGAPRVGLDAAFAGAKLDPGEGRLTIWLSIPGGTDKADEPYGFYVYDWTQESPSWIESIQVDTYSGQEIHREGWRDKSAIQKVDAARYAIHVGAFLGLPGRIAACVASLILAALCITGPWMWWKRRPEGKLGVPPATRAPWSLYVLLAIVGWILPTIGVTLLAFAAIEVVRWFVRTRVTRLGL